MTEADERPSWARRIRAERDARDWSQRDAVRALRAHHTGSHALPSEATILRNWRRWEAADSYPDDLYRPLIAKTFGTVTDAIFPRAGRRDGDSEILAVSGQDALEVISRLRASDVNEATLDALRITVDRLCSEYPHMPSAALRVEGVQWLNRITRLLDSRLTLKQHRELLSLAGWLALLVGCVEYDMDMRGSANATRKAALSLGTESDSGEIAGWANEMAAWFALTQGDYQGTITAGEAGRAVGGHHSVGVQLAAQKAKAWARLGDRRQVEIALDQGRNLLESLPQADNLDHHFVVDPAKFDFYAMDCYRVLGEDKLAEAYAREVVRAGTGYDGSERSPMRNAEARITLGVVAARRGDVELAVALGREALAGSRKSLPSLLMCSRELARTARKKAPGNPQVVEYLEQLRALTD